MQKNHHERSISTAIAAYEPSIKEKNGWDTSRDTTKLFWNLTILDHMLQNGWKPTAAKRVKT